MNMGIFRFRSFEATICSGACRCSFSFFLSEVRKGTYRRHDVAFLLKSSSRSLLPQLNGAQAATIFLRGERNAGAPVVQKGHLPDSLSSLMRLAFDASKLRHTSRSAEKSMQPRLRAFFSAVRTKRIAASPDKTGMLLIARAISDLPFAAYYSKN